MADFTEAIRLNPNLVEAYVKRGDCYSNRSDMAIVADYTEAIRLNPKDANIYRKRGDAYESQPFPERAPWHDKAIADFKEAIHLNGKDNTSLSDAYTCRGHAYRRKGDLERAIADCTEAIRLHPNDFYAYDLRGRGLPKKGEIEKGKYRHRESPPTAWWHFNG